VKHITPAPAGPTRLSDTTAAERDTLIETAVDDLKTRVVAASGAAVSGVEGLPLNHDVVGVIHASGPGGAFALLRRGEGASREDVVEVYNGNPPAKVASATFTLEGPAAQPSYALSADGQRIARIADFPKLSVRVATVADSKETAVVELDGNLGRPTLLGFTAPDRVLVRWEKGNVFGLEVEDLRTHKHGRRVELPDHDPSPSSWAISPDGRFFAYAASTPGKNAISLASLFEGGRPRQLPVNAIDPKLGIRPSGLAFSADGGKLSALYVQGASAVIASWNARSGPALPEVTISAAVQSLEALPGAGAAAHGAFARGGPNSLSYVGNGALLIGGSLLISVADGKPLVELGITSPFAQMVASDSSVFVAVRDGAKPVGLLTVAFDPKHIPATPGRAAPAAAPAPKPASSVSGAGVTAPKTSAAH
jgi:hypothetical protein